MKAVSTRSGAKQRILGIAATVVLALALSGTMPVATAQPGKDGDRGARGPGSEQMQRGDMGRRDDMQNQRGMREREEMRRGMQQMSPDERQQLRRDIRNHGREVYGDRDPRRGDGRQR